MLDMSEVIQGFIMGHGTAGLKSFKVLLGDMGQQVTNGRVCENISVVSQYRIPEKCFLSLISV